MGIFTPAWQGKNEEKALRAVSKIADRAKLEEIANSAPLDVARYLAIKKVSVMPNAFGVAEKLFNNSINTQPFLQVVALTDNDRMFRQYAVAKLTNQALIAQIAKNDANEFVRHVAVERLTDQGVLSDIAKNDQEYYVRLGAVKKLTDQTLLAFIAKNDRHENVRSEAVKKVNAQSILADVALNDKHWGTRMNAIVKVTNQSVIGNYLVSEPARKGSYGWFHQHCKPLELLGKIDTQSIIAYVAENTADAYVGEKAVEKITDESVFIAIAKNSECAARVHAAGRITDGNALAELAMKTDDSSVRQEAIGKLSDPAFLYNIAKNDADINIRFFALRQLDKSCSHEWNYDEHCRRKCVVCGLYEYGHDYVEINSIDYGGASHSIDYECKRCGHKANYSQGETSARDGRESGYILE